MGTAVAITFGDTPYTVRFARLEAPRMERRTFLRLSTIGTGAIAFSGSLWESAALAAPAQNAPSPYGALQPANSHGIQLPPGFTSQIVARSRQGVPGTTYVWHDAPDG